MLADINGYISASGDGSVLKNNIYDIIAAIKNVSNAIYNVVSAISSNENYSGINSSFEDWAYAESAFAEAASGVLGDDSGSSGSNSDLICLANSLQDLAGAVYTLIGVINGLPSDSAVALGRAVIFYDLSGSILDLANIRDNLADTLFAVALESDDASELDSIAQSLKQGAYSGLYSAFVNAANA